MALDLNVLNKIATLVTEIKEYISNAITEHEEDEEAHFDLFEDKADAEHNHDDRYFTESEINETLEDYLITPEFNSSLGTSQLYLGMNSSGQVLTVPIYLSSLSNSAQLNYITKDITGVSIGNQAEINQAINIQFAHVQDLLSGKASSDHNHDSTYFKLSGGTITGDITAITENKGIIEANKFIKYGATSSDFLKGDGSLDSNTYIIEGSSVSQLIDPNSNNYPSIGNMLSNSTQQHINNVLNQTLYSMKRDIATCQNSLPYYVKKSEVRYEDGVLTI